VRSPAGQGPAGSSTAARWPRPACCAAAASVQQCLSRAPPSFSPSVPQPPHPAWPSRTRVHLPPFYVQVFTALTHSANVDVHDVISTDAGIHQLHANAEQFDRKTELSFKYLQVGGWAPLQQLTPLLPSPQSMPPLTPHPNMPHNRRCSPPAATPLPTARMTWQTPLAPLPESTVSLPRGCLFYHLLPAAPACSMQHAGCRAWRRAVVPAAIASSPAGSPAEAPAPLRLLMPLLMLPC
jgi:hypothetical protein